MKLTVKASYIFPQGKLFELYSDAGILIVGFIMDNDTTHCIKILTL